MTIIVLYLCFFCTKSLNMKWGKFIPGVKDSFMQLGSLKRFIAAAILVPSIVINPISPISPPPAHAAQQVEVLASDLNRLKLGLREITYLIDNWDEKTTYCNFGEFQRELLLPENKGKLLDAAKEFSLWDYDKSKTMNVMCKRDPQVVRLVLIYFMFLFA